MPAPPEACVGHRFSAWSYADCAPQLDHGSAMFFPSASMAQPLAVESEASSIPRCEQGPSCNGSRHKTKLPHPDMSSPTDNPLALNLVVLRSSNLERARGFYERLDLQFTRHRHGSGPEHLSAELGGCVFELYPQSSNDVSTLGTRIGFRVPSLETAIAALNDFPTAIISPPQVFPWGRRAVVADPDGHRIELVQK